MKYDPNRKWIIEVTEQQLIDIINDVEDIHRFLAGQTELANTTSYIEDCSDMLECRHKLEILQPLVTPDLTRGASYSWDGGECPYEAQRAKIARGYAEYRNLRYCLEKFRDHDDWNTYKSPTLTCGIPLAICYPKPDESNMLP